MSKLAPTRMFVVVVLMLAMSCAMDASRAEPEGAIERIDSALTSVIAVDFSSYPLGSLGAPWSITPASGVVEGSASVVASSEHGKVLRMSGSRTSGQFLIAELPFSAAGPRAEVSFQVAPDQNSNFVFFLNAVRVGYRSSRISLQLSPGSNELVRVSSYPQVSCGTLRPGTWSSVQISIRSDVSPSTYDVRINGVLKPECASQTTPLRLPLRSLQLMDASNDGWGGDVLFDDFAVAGS